MEFELTPGKRNGSMLLYAEKFLFKQNKAYNGKKTYQCYETNCRARVVVDGGLCSRPKVEHNHPEMSALKEEMAIKHEMKKQATKGNLPVRQVFNEVVAR